MLREWCLSVDGTRMGTFFFSHEDVKGWVRIEQIMQTHGIKEWHWRTIDNSYDENGKSDMIEYHNRTVGCAM